MTVPAMNTISNGSPADATEVEANFNILETYCNGISDGTNIDAGAIVAASLATGSVTTDKIGALAVTTAKLAADAVTGAKIADDTIDSEHYAAGSIDAEHLATGSVTSAKIGNDQVDSQHYAAGSIDNEHLAADCVNGSKIADSSINSEHYANRSIDAIHIATGTITANELAAGSVGSSEIATNAVGASEIAAGAVGSSEIATGAVDTDELASGAVTDAKTDFTTLPTIRLTTGAGASNNCSVQLVGAANTGFYFPSAGGGDMNLVCSGTAILGLNTTGTYHPLNYNLTTGSAANVFITSSGLLQRSTSAAKYKTNVRDVTLDEAKVLLEARGVIYNSLTQEDDPSQEFVGRIADEMMDKDERLVSVIDGEVEGYAYEREVVFLTELVKDLYQRLEAVEARCTC